MELPKLKTCKKFSIRVKNSGFLIAYILAVTRLNFLKCLAWLFARTSVILINYNPTPEISITGTYDDATGSYTLTCTFTNYQSAVYGIGLNGTMTVAGNFQNPDFDFIYIGDIEITYQGTTYICKWDFSFSYSSGTFVSSGYYEIDGYRYDFSYSGSV